MEGVLIVLRGNEIELQWERYTGTWERQCLEERFVCLILISRFYITQSNNLSLG